jgi:hypothetical protein
MQEQTDLVNTIHIIFQRTTYCYVLPILHTNYKNVCWTQQSTLALFGALLGVSKIRWKFDYKMYVI